MGIESILREFESMAFSFTFSSLGIRISQREIQIHSSEQTLLEFKIESIAWGFESTSLSKPFLKSRFKSIFQRFESWSSAKLIGNGIQISFFNFFSLSSLKMGFESSFQGFESFSLFLLVLLLFDKCPDEFESEHQKMCSKFLLVKFFKV